ncbi:MAG TPA: hypothetical protein VMG59_02455 [Phycisphaerae bacterium]|nr:hypothetical protein [Phycisphaerae bacterium]
MFVGQVWGDTQTTTAQNFVPKVTKQTIRTVTDELNSDNPKQIDQAIGQIKFWISSGGQTPPQLGQQWLPTLVSQQRYQDAADIALNASTAQPNIPNISLCMPWRIRALLALGKSQEALQNAKSFYNVCDAQHIGEATELVAQCLTVCNPNNLQIVVTFRNQQNNSAEGTNDSTSVLNSVEIDSMVYNDAIDKWNSQSLMSGKFYDYVAYGNLLLMSDRTQDAQKVFNNLYQYLAESPDETEYAAQSLARCMRAEDGTPIRANAWLAALEKKNPQPTPATPPTIVFAPRDNKQADQVVTNELSSGNPQQINQAIGQIDFWITGGHVPRNLGNSWLSALIKDQQFQAAADAALNGSLAQPNITNITSCMPWRIKALLALNKPQEALDAAKSYYNVCNMQKTNDAVDLVAQCLAAYHPDDLQIAQAFRAEQSGSGAGNANSSNQTEADVVAGNAPPSQSASMLQSVQIDQTLYNTAIGKWNAQSTVSGKFYDYVAYGNLLLMADRGQDAQNVFTRLFQLANTQQELNDAAEGIARSMRAEDGTVFRANAWLISLQKQSGAPAAAPK